MNIQFSTLNWLAILLAFGAYFILGALWFTLFFKKQYLTSLGKVDQPQNTSPIYIAGPAVCTLIITFCHAILMENLSIRSYEAAINFALLVGSGYLVANTVNIAIN